MRQQLKGNKLRIMATRKIWESYANSNVRKGRLRFTVSRWVLSNEVSERVNNACYCFNVGVLVIKFVFKHYMFKPLGSRDACAIYVWKCILCIETLDTSRTGSWDGGKSAIWITTIITIWKHDCCKISKTNRRQSPTELQQLQLYMETRLTWSFTLRGVTLKPLF